MYTNKQTWVAHRIFTRRAVFLHTAVRTSVVLSAFNTGVVFSIERAGAASFAFGRIVNGLGNEFLARSALCDWHQHNARCNGGGGGAVDGRGAERRARLAQINDSSEAMKTILRTK